MLKQQTITTDTLEIAYWELNDPNGRPVLLLHGWPDDATIWQAVGDRLAAAGMRVISPWLRGFGPTRFKDPGACRDGRAEALARDALDLIDGLQIERFAVVGHDWGARTAY